MLTDLWPQLYRPNPLAISLLEEALASWPPAVRTPPPTAWTREGARVVLLAFVEAHGRLPITAEWRNARRHGLPSPNSIRRHWGSLTHCCKVLGLTLNPPPRCNQYTQGRDF